MLTTEVCSYHYHTKDVDIDALTEIVEQMLRKLSSTKMTRLDEKVMSALEWLGRCAS